MIQYPGTQVPLPQAEYSARTVTNTVTTTFSSGRPRRRRLGVGKYYAAKFVWQLSPEEYDFFMGWWEHSLRLGTMPFVVSLATGGILGEHTVLLIGEPDGALQNYFWKVSCEAVILKKPELQNYEIAIRSDGTTLGEFVVLEEEINTVVNTDYPSYLEG